MQTIAQQHCYGPTAYLTCPPLLTQHPCGGVQTQVCPPVLTAYPCGGGRTQSPGSRGTASA